MLAGALHTEILANQLKRQFRNTCIYICITTLMKLNERRDTKRPPPDHFRKELPGDGQHLPGYYK